MNEDAPQQDAGENKGGLPVKTVAVILALLVAEGAAIVFFMSMMGKPSDVAAAELMSDPDQGLSEVNELPVLQDKFSNAKQGRLWIWDMEIVVAVEARHMDEVQGVLDRCASLIRSGIGRIIASAQHTYFQEPGYDTVRRQILDFLNSEELVGTDPEGEAMILDVLIPSCIGFPADY